MRAPRAPRSPRVLLNYRPDIDGLRALAIALVVLFHAHAPGFGGGFIGVDVFFVISGFLIAQWVEELGRRGPGWLAEFYRRRVVRLLPAALVVLVATVPPAMWLMLPHDLESYFRSLAATAALGANVWFWTQSGYFGAAAVTQPLVHMWSLAIEQHFYLLYPALLAGARVLRLPPLRVLALVLLASLGLSLWGAAQSPTAAFYLTPARLWQLLLGSVLALARPPLPRSSAARGALAWLGLALIGIAAWQVDGRTAWPGPWALLPCVGAALLLWAGQDASIAAARLLSMRPLVALGLVSYSLYLWHWPLLALARYWAIEPLGGPWTAAAVAASLVLAALTWRWVEQPARRVLRAQEPRRVLALSCAALAALCALALAGAAGRGWPERVPDYQAYLAMRAELQKHCPVSFAADACAIGIDGAPAFVVWGDSHANAIAPVFDELGRTHRLAGLRAALPGCPPLLGWRSRSDHCESRNQALVAAVQPGMLVFLDAYWPREFATDPERLEEGLQESLHLIRAKGARAVVLGPLPDFPLGVPELMMRGRKDLVVRPRDLVNARVGPVAAVLARVAAAEGAEYVDLLGRVCDARACYGAGGKDPWFADTDHLSAAGARRMGPLIEPLLLTLGTR